MKNTIFLCVFVMLIAGCNSTKKIGKHPDYKITGLFNGTCKTGAITSEKLEVSPTGKVGLFGTMNLVEKTDTIKANLGSTYCFIYKIEGKSSDAKSTNSLIEVEQTWIPPKPIVNTAGKSFPEISYKIEQIVGGETPTSYTFEEKYEIVKGVWVFQVGFEGVILYKKQFYLE